MKMIVSEAIVKEVNQYYARKEGRRTANIPSFANFMKKAAGSGKAAPKTVDKTASDTGAQNTAKSGEASPAQTGNANSCCEQCRLTSQLMVQMMSRSLYNQSGLGYYPMGSGALSAYQNMMNLLGSNTGLS